MSQDRGRDGRIAELQAELDRIHRELSPLFDARRREEASGLVGQYFTRHRSEYPGGDAMEKPAEFVQYAKCIGVSDGEYAFPMYGNIFEVGGDGQLTVGFRDHATLRTWSADWSPISGAEYAAAWAHAMDLIRLFAAAIA